MRNVSSAFFLIPHRHDLISSPPPRPIRNSCFHILPDSFYCYVIHLLGIDLVLGLTGEELSGDAWVSVLDRDVDEHLEKERKDYLSSLDDAKKAGEAKEEEEPDLNMTIRFVDGDVLISDSSKNHKGVFDACREFEMYVLAKFSDE